MIDNFIQELRQAGICKYAKGGLYHPQAETFLPMGWLQDVFTERHPTLNWCDYDNLILGSMKTIAGITCEPQSPKYLDEGFGLILNIFHTEELSHEL